MNESFPRSQPEDWKERREKPAVLYHVSEREGIIEFVPRAESVRDPKEGSVIFATPDKAYALQFLVPGDSRDSKRGYYNGIPTVVIRNSRETFLEGDRGGWLYEFPSDSFDFDSTKQMRDREWTSRTRVKPLGSAHYTSTVDALLDNGVQVYFVDDETFTKMQSEKNAGFETLLTLESENMRRRKNVRKYIEE